MKSALSESGKATAWAACLPLDMPAATLVGRVWMPSTSKGITGGPCVAAFRETGVFDLSMYWPTMSDLLEEDDPAACASKASGSKIGSLESVIHASLAGNNSQPRCVAPFDLQVIKAAGVTFAASMIERVIEEQSRGDPALATHTRGRVLSILGGTLSGVVPGSAKAAEIKLLLVQEGLWSQYLEVGIGPDAELFTKAPVLSSVGLGADIGIHPMSEWNNPEPELVLAIDSRGRIKGASLGNDVNLRDFEGRSALLLGKAKDNNASCAIGPFLRLFDDSYNLDDVRRSVITLEVDGSDGFSLKGESSMAQISRDPASLVQQTIGAHHQYPDGVALFLGTMFPPVQDRGAPGCGFTHHPGDCVRIHTPGLGTLVNTVQYCDQVTPWTFGVRALFQHISGRASAQARARSVLQ